MNKLIACVMGQNAERFIKMCLESIKDADSIVYCDGGSTDKTGQLFTDFVNSQQTNTSWIGNKYNQEDKQMNGKQRNFYLNYLKENYPNDWALCLDADEVVEDLSKIKEFIQTAEAGLYSVHMRHLIQDLAHEDATSEIHFVPHRLFKISEAGEYPLTEHPVLIGKGDWKQGQTNCTTIWHLAYIPNLWEIKRRYDNHLKKSEMHTPQFLKQWYYWHIFGSYPKKEFNPVELPKIVLDEFNIEKDELYFINRGIDMKHPLMVKQWYDYFIPSSVLDLGCGRGCYLYFWRWFVSDCGGIELSEWAQKNAFTDKIILGDISDEKNYETHDLITAIDVLEHLDDTQLHDTLRNMSNHGSKFIFSIPFIGDPNLLNDKTHKQFRKKENWIKLIESHGIKIKETPKDWYFAHQILIGEK